MISEMNAYQLHLLKQLLQAAEAVLEDPNAFALDALREAVDRVRTQPGAKAFARTTSAAPLEDDSA